MDKQDFLLVDASNKKNIDGDLDIRLKYTLFCPDLLADFETQNLGMGS
jgi:hypothetical protein